MMYPWVKTYIMLARAKTYSFIDDLTIELQEAKPATLLVALKGEDGKICRKTEKKVDQANSLIRWEGLNDLPYGVYTLECSQGKETVALKLVKRV